MGMEALQNRKSRSFLCIQNTSAAEGSFSPLLLHPKDIGTRQEHQQPHPPPTISWWPGGSLSDPFPYPEELHRPARMWLVPCQVEDFSRLVGTMANTPHPGGPWQAGKNIGQHGCSTQRISGGLVRAPMRPPPTWRSLTGPMRSSSDTLRSQLGCTPWTGGSDGLE